MRPEDAAGKESPPPEMGTAGMASQCRERMLSAGAWQIN